MVVRGSDRKAGLDDINTEVAECSGNLKLLGDRHRAARRLLAVTQRRIENGDVGHGGRVGNSRDEVEKKVVRMRSG